MISSAICRKKSPKMLKRAYLTTSLATISKLDYVKKKSLGRLILNFRWMEIRATYIIYVYVMSYFDFEKIMGAYENKKVCGT